MTRRSPDGVRPDDCSLNDCITVDVGVRGGDNPLCVVVRGGGDAVRRLPLRPLGDFNIPDDGVGGADDLAPTRDAGSGDAVSRLGLNVRLLLFNILGEGGGIREFAVDMLFDRLSLAHLLGRW